MTTTRHPAAVVQRGLVSQCLNLTEVSETDSPNIAGCTLTTACVPTFTLTSFRLTAVDPVTAENTSCESCSSIISMNE